jgi:hypothetical protein
MKKKFYAFLLILPLGFILVNLDSCQGPQPVKCVITVFDSAGQKTLAGVKVHLYSNVTYNGSTTAADLKADAVTDGSGKVNFTFKNPCIMDITATVPTCTAVPSHRIYCTGIGVVNMATEGQTTNKSIYVNQ